ncbi:hypothetical protein [Pedobacter sp. Hv1]|uniref:hypothetical protein n=1 Tax=Pedobacter sp. Hv1 TaxID=1740090 RepID=UPI0006D89194|nr:hypothetical protein [Pedobacter sp. Hv1]KQB99366.1 hypothetical protein AQF98_17490 [Pedobacter sp. Hv1]
MKNNRLILLITVLLFNVAVTFSQSRREAEISTVEHFVKAIFLEKNTLGSVVDNFIYFEPVDNAKYTRSARIKILAKHLKKIKKEKSVLFDPKDFHIVAYNNYENNKVRFSKMTKDVFILVSKNKPVMYFYLKNARILSFDYIIKGDEGLFITY